MMATATVPAGSVTNQARSRAYLHSRLAAKDTTTDSEFTIPTIDLTPSFSKSLEDRLSVAAQIRKACTTSGFFYITHHRIPSTTLQSILNQAERFFRLPEATKQELHIKKSKYGYGWEPSEYTSIAGDKETKEGYNFGYEEGLDRSGGDGKYRNLDGTDGKANVWPKEEDLPGFYEAVGEYYGAVLDLARHLFRLFALSLDLPEDHFDSVTTHPGGIARLLYYPPPKNPQPGKSGVSREEEHIGIGAHSDYECFTLLLTSTTPGLEILKPSGHWHTATHIPDAFIINVADFLMRWTNGVYKSAIHRVVNRSSYVRYSVPFFFSINYEAVVETLPTCLGEGEKPKYPPIGAGENILERLNDTTKDGAGFFGNGEVFDKDEKN